MEPVLPRRRFKIQTNNDIDLPLPPPPAKLLPEETAVQLPPKVPDTWETQRPMPLEEKEKKIEIRLLGQGSYGCVFKPQITCDGSLGDSRYVSKIQDNDEDIQHELDFGDKIKAIDKFELFYAPILESCPVSLNTISDSEIKKCDILNGMPAANLLGKFISTKIKYVGENNIKSYLSKLPPIKEVVEQKLYATYQYLLYSLEKLAENNLVHFDIKEKNIMYDEKNHSPIIIDFGLSFDVSAIHTADRGKVFYTTDFYLYWCIDIYIISYVVNTVNIEGAVKNVTIDILTVLLDTFFTNLQKDMNTYALPMSNEESRLLKEKHFDFFKPYIGQPWETVVDVLTTSENCFTWDIYSLAMAYLMICRTVNVNQYESDIAHKLGGTEADVFSGNDNAVVGKLGGTEADVFSGNDNAVVGKLVTLWKSIISSLPNSRPSFKGVKDAMDMIFLYTPLNTEPDTRRASGL
jgi:hypothetical protein